MDYGNGIVSVEFRVRLRSAEFEVLFERLGLGQALIAPVRAILRAEGKILSDHSFAGGLRGSCNVEGKSALVATESPRDRNASFEVGTSLRSRPGSRFESSKTWQDRHANFIRPEDPVRSTCRSRSEAART